MTGVRGGDRMGLKCPILSDPSTVQSIIQGIKKQVKSGEIVTVGSLKEKLFDVAQMTRQEVAQFLKAHGKEVFERYPKGSVPGQRCDCYMMKAPVNDGGGVHG